MTEVYDPDAILADPDAHPIHKKFAAINIGVRDRGERWSKCANCGDPYQIVHKGDPMTLILGSNFSFGVTAEEDWTDETVCSEVCFEEYKSYLFSGDF